MSSHEAVYSGAPHERPLPASALTLTSDPHRYSTWYHILHATSFMQGSRFKISHCSDASFNHQSEPLRAFVRVLRGGGGFEARTQEMAPAAQLLV